MPGFRFVIEAGAVTFDTSDVDTEVEHDDVVIYSINMTTKYAQVLVYQGLSVVFAPSPESIGVATTAQQEFTTFTVPPPHGGGSDDVDWAIQATVSRYTATVVVWRA